MPFDGLLVGVTTGTEEGMVDGGSDSEGTKDGDSDKVNVGDMLGDLGVETGAAVGNVALRSSGREAGMGDLSSNNAGSIVGARVGKEGITVETVKPFSGTSAKSSVVEFSVALAMPASNKKKDADRIECIMI